MKILGVHPGPFFFHTTIFVRLEPLGLALIGEAVRRMGHEIRLLDLQIESHANFLKTLRDFQPDVVMFACNYLANVPDVVDLAKTTKERLPGSFVVVGGHSASFIAEEVLEHGGGAIDCVLKGEGEANLPLLLQALDGDRDSLELVPGAVTLRGEGPPPQFVNSLDDIMPARDLLPHRRKYYMGVLDPCASIEFSRGCPWDCSFCSAWTFYGRSYRAVSPEKVVEELERIKEPGIWIVDDVAFLQSKAGMRIGEAIIEKGIEKEFYLETRGDVLVRNLEVFRFWKNIGLEYLFLGIEAIDQEGLERYRKRTTEDKNLEALELARELGMTVIINLIAEPDWDRDRFRAVREWSMNVPEVVNVSVATPYPGTELWQTAGHNISTRDYRLFDIQHAVSPTKLPLQEFYEELTSTQKLIVTKNLRWSSARGLAKISAKLLMRGQTNFLKTIFTSRDAYKPLPLLRAHEQPIKYEMKLPPPSREKIDPKSLYIHEPMGRKGRQIDKSTESFVDQTRMGTSI